MGANLETSSPLNDDRSISFEGDLMNRPEVAQLPKNPSSPMTISSKSSS